MYDVRSILLIYSDVLFHISGPQNTHAHIHSITIVMLSIWKFAQEANLFCIDFCGDSTNIYIHMYLNMFTIEASERIIRTLVF